jgi:hypothetical protein
VFIIQNPEFRIALRERNSSRCGCEVLIADHTRNESLLDKILEQFDLCIFSSVECEKLLTAVSKENAKAGSA